MRALEVLFDDVELRKLRARFPNHPAVVRYDVMRQFLSKSLALSYPDETAVVLQIGSIILDVVSYDEPPDQAIARLEPEVLRQLRLRVADPNQFADQIAVLSCWSMLRSKDIPARVIEQEGLPDIEVPFAESNRSHWIEAKRLRIGKKSEQTRSVISYANKQIKRGGDGVGSVYLHVERPQERVVFDDRVPAAVQSYIDHANRELHSGFSRSVAEVIVAWDDYMLLGTPPARTTYFLRRRTKVLLHAAPRAKSLLQGDALEMGRTVMLPIEWSSSRGAATRVLATQPIQVGTTTVTELFRKECEIPGYVRSVHVIEALSSPDQITRYDIGGSVVILATRRIAQGAEPYTLLILAAERLAGQTEIYLGLRVYFDLNYDGNDLTPWTAFEAFLRRYGFPIWVGNQSGLFIPAARVEATQAAETEIVRGAPPPNEPVCLNAMMRRDAAGSTDVSWAFGFLTGRYGADVRRRQW
jgi:hypothetical protein